MSAMCQIPNRTRWGARTKASNPIAGQIANCVADHVHVSFEGALVDPPQPFAHALVQLVAMGGHRNPASPARHYGVRPP
jgi:hypothetical protein